MKRMISAALVAAFALPAVAVAQDGVLGSLTAEETKKVARFGRDIGHAYQCADKDARAAMKEDMRLVFDFIVQDMGTDAGFLYSVALGYGGAESNEDADCEGLAARWQDVRKRFDLVEEGE